MTFIFQDGRCTSLIAAGLVAAATISLVKKEDEAETIDTDKTVLYSTQRSMQRS
jgi:hypothetical protein